MSTPEGEEPPGREEFVASLTRFGEQRGINVDFQARVNTKHIDLYKLWNVVKSKGGYDAVSGEKLAWRKVGLDFNLGSANAAAYAFALKTAYYKNLAAYEIKTLHGREPPPIEILEKLTAKGGDILSRTVENFRPPQRSSFINGDSDSGGEESKTPKDEKMDIDEPGSIGRSTRGLRQAPPQRIPFQPDVSSSRQLRHSSGHAQSPQPTAMAHTGYNYSASSNPNSAQFAIANYEPRPQMPLTLRPIMTPSYNAAMFEERQKIARMARKVELGLLSPSTKGMMKPGAGFDGPNIYVRTLQGLRSHVPEEQDYALHHLVKISHERGDKYKFDAFPNLAEGLIEYVLGVSSLFYDVKWEICYSDYEDGTNVLDGIRGTPDILQRIQSLKRIDTPDEMESEEFARKLTKVLEAGLTIRNLSLLEDNAVYLSEMAQLRDFLSIALNLPNSPLITELKHYALDISEQVTKYWRMDESDPLYKSLLSQLNTGIDRGAILTALRAISRISMNLDDTNLLKGVPVSVVKRICEWTLLDDEDLVSACLDFLYQFTAVPENVAFLLNNSKEVSLPSFLGQLTRLLQYHARTEILKTEATKAIAAASATEIPNVPQDLMDQFLKYEEPDRSNHWLKAVFEEDAESDITQIALWQAYQARFTDYTSPTTQLLPAAEFIKNVSTIFAGANAQVVNGVNHKFIIKGIRPRHAPMDPKGRVYNRCLWKVPGSKACGEYFLKPKHMFDHLVYDHLGIDRRDDGTWAFESTTRTNQCPDDCYWSSCRHFTNGGKVPSPYQLGMHIKTHLPDVSNKAVLRQKNNRTPANQTALPHKKTYGKTMPTEIVDVDPAQGREATYNYQTYQNTAVDELGNAAGLPLTSVLVLRNLARNIPKAAALLDTIKRDAFRIDCIEKLFGPLKDRFLFVMAHNRPLAGGSKSDMALSSMSSASTVMQAPVTLHLCKFSHCTSPNPQAKIIWTHLPQRSDMFAVLDVVRKVETGSIVSETKVLRVIRGRELLEEVTFPELQHQVRLDEERALSQPVPDNLLRVLVIVKKPLLALRYMLPDRQIRKTQMKFEPESGCDVALEAFMTAGLPIRNKNLLQVQGQGPQLSQPQSHSQARPVLLSGDQVQRLQSSQLQPHSQEQSGSLNALQAQRPQSSQLQPHSQEQSGSLNAPQVQRLQSSQLHPYPQEWPGFLNASEAARSQSSQCAFPASSQLASQEGTLIRKADYNNIPPSAQPANGSIWSTSALSGVNQDEFSRPISASSRSYLDAFGSTTTATSVPTLAKPRNQKGLLPSPVFNGSYEPFGNSRVRPMSAPEQTQTQSDYNNTLTLSPMLPPQRTLPFPDKKIHPFWKDEVASQEESKKKTTNIKTNSKRQTKPRAQPVKPRKSRAKVDATHIPSDPMSTDPLQREPPPYQSCADKKAPSSSAPPKARAKAKVSSPTVPTRNPSTELKATLTLSKPSASSNIIPRKRSLIDQSLSQSNKRQTQAMTKFTAETLTTTPGPTTAVVEQKPHRLLPATDPFIKNNPNQGLLDNIDNLMSKYNEHEAQSDKDRAQAIIDMLSECNKDDGFDELMDDIEGAWKRIGLGLCGP